MVCLFTSTATFLTFPLLGYDIALGPLSASRMCPRSSQRVAALGAVPLASRGLCLMKDFRAVAFLGEIYFTKSETRKGKL